MATSAYLHFIQQLLERFVLQKAKMVRKVFVLAWLQTFTTLVPLYTCKNHSNGSLCVLHINVFSHAVSGMAETPRTRSWGRNPRTVVTERLYGAARSLKVYKSCSNPITAHTVREMKCSLKFNVKCSGDNTISLYAVHYKVICMLYTNYYTLVCKITPN